MLFQDLSLVGLLLLVPILSGRTPSRRFPALAQAAAAIGVVALVSRFMLPILFRLVAIAVGARRSRSVLRDIGTARASSPLGIRWRLVRSSVASCRRERDSHQAYADQTSVTRLSPGCSSSAGDAGDPTVIVPSSTGDCHCGCSSSSRRSRQGHSGRGHDGAGGDAGIGGQVGESHSSWDALVEVGLLDCRSGISCWRPASSR
jgi:hypothetical protein